MIILTALENYVHVNCLALVFYSLKISRMKKQELLYYCHNVILLSIDFAPEVHVNNLDLGTNENMLLQIYYKIHQKVGLFL